MYCHRGARRIVAVWHWWLDFASRKIYNSCWILAFLGILVASSIRLYFGGGKKLIFPEKDPLDGNNFPYSLSCTWRNFSNQTLIMLIHCSYIHIRWPSCPLMHFPASYMSRHQNSKPSHISIDLWCFAWNIIIYDSTVKPPSNIAQTCKRNKIILHTCAILEFWMMVGQTAHFTPRCKDACNYGRVIYVFNPVVVVVATRPSKTRACRCSHLIGLQRVWVLLLYTRTYTKFDGCPFWVFIY